MSRRAPRLVRGARLAWLRALAPAIFLVAGCTAAPAPPSPSDADARAAGDVLPTCPPETRLSSGGPEPRSPGYWVTWSSCGADSQAAVASANGGRAAGWILLDDLLADPGITLGQATLEGCAIATAVLAEPPPSQAEPVVRTLARQVLAADLNLASGAETCPAAEATRRLGQAMLTRLDYDPEALFQPPAAGNLDMAAELARLLGTYNEGLLCQ